MSPGPPTPPLLHRQDARHVGATVDICPSVRRGRSRSVVCGEPKSLDELRRPASSASAVEVRSHTETRVRRVNTHSKVKAGRQCPVCRKINGRRVLGHFCIWGTSQTSAVSQPDGLGSGSNGWALVSVGFKCPGPVPSSHRKVDSRGLVFLLSFPCCPTPPRPQGSPVPSTCRLFVFTEIRLAPPPFGGETERRLLTRVLFHRALRLPCPLDPAGLPVVFSPQDPTGKRG